MQDMNDEYNIYFEMFFLIVAAGSYFYYQFYYLSEEWNSCI